MVVILALLEAAAVFFAMCGTRLVWTPEALLGWRQGVLTIANADSLLREAGYYKRSDADTSRFGAGIVVVNSIGTDSIDFVVDFTNMHPVSFYFPAVTVRR